MGCAMGTICAQHTLMFLWHNLKQKIYTLSFMENLFISKIIEDIFIIWNGTTEELILFIVDLNKKHKTIKFDYKISTKQIGFLDTMVYRDQQHKIQTTIFRKPTDQQTNLHAESNHPKSLKDSIPYSQALSIKTICSTTSEFNKNFEIITKRFKEGGYPKKVVNEQVDKVKKMKRTTT